MNLQDILADRQIALMQNRKQIAIGQNPHLTNPDDASTSTSTLPHRATRPAPPPPTIALAKNRDAGEQVDPTDVGHSRQPSPGTTGSTDQVGGSNENVAIGVPGASNRSSSDKVVIGPNGKPLVQPQPGSKEDLRRRNLMREERERLEG
jgi:hypothetical protein